nr:MAG TPA: hypothetical protein [Caudoviricetes sp.]
MFSPLILLVCFYDKQIIYLCQCRICRVIVNFLLTASLFHYILKP